ncbi:ANTH domain-containing protein [Earliella scabrosa]|nr:ANTH domain-containing protein [Earliella scabrosa]
MTSFEKTVKLACKPKAAPPKSKYLDPIIAATWSEDGAVHDVCKALSPRFREPNVIVVFKALIVLHTIIRNGSTDNVLQYLSSSDVLKLRNVSSGNWEGYQAPQNLQNYAKYLDTRIRAYRELKHDAIRVQSETNRDMRNSQAIDEEMDQSTRKRGKNAPPPPSSSSLSRSKTMAGRKLRVMTVEKGLLRETKIVQRMVDSLVDCRFYLDDLEDELNITALRMLVKDLLILFQACNEGVINVLEHYFEMSKIDAQDALAIYKHFCKQTEQVVEYLGVARKLQNLLNVPIPNLRHAPVSLASSLEEYLNDPNFEQNRIEYKTQKEAAERNAKLGIKASPKPVEKPPSPKPAEASSSQAADSSAQKTPGQKAMVDFFTAIEEEQQTMFNPQTNSPTMAYFQQQAMQNPFQQQMMTGAILGAQAFGQQPQLQAQPTGFILPQQTAMPMGTNPFGLQASQQQQQLQQPTFQSFLAPQQTGFLQPQMTGANPFRQSTLFPQTTGMPFGGQNMMGASSSTNPFPMQSAVPQQSPPQNASASPFQPSQFGQQSASPLPGGGGQPSFPFSTTMTAAPSAPAPSGPSIAQPFAQPFSQQASTSAPPRSATAPLTGPGTSSSPPPAQPVKTHQTGSRNPFGQVVTPPPPVPKPPTLMELAMGIGSQNNPGGAGSPGQQSSQQPQQQQPMQTGAFPSFGNFGSSFPAQNNGASSAGTPSSNTNTSTNGSLMANIASSFALGGTDSSKPGSAPNSAFTSPLVSQPTSSTTTGSTFSDTLFSSVSSQPTGATSISGGAPSISISSAGGAAPLQRQTTGFSGLKAFKPSSSFGAALLESLPPIPSAPSTPAGSPPSSTPGSTISSQTTGFPGLSSQPTGLGSSLGVGLRPQATGTLGGANPFRASMFALSSSPSPAGGLGAGPTPSFLNSTSSPSSGGPGAFGSSASSTSPFGLGGLGTNPTGAPSPFGASAFGLGAGMNGMNGMNDPSKQQQQQPQQQQSLI